MMQGDDGDASGMIQADLNLSLSLFQYRNGNYLQLMLTILDENDALSVAQPVPPPPFLEQSGYF